MSTEENITYFGQTDSRAKVIPFGIKSKDRTRHVYIIGKTGMGKSTVLENMAVQDITSGNGFAFIDPHGKSADLLLQYIPEERRKDVLYFAPFDVGYPISFNVLEDVGQDKRHLVVNGLMSAFKKIWLDAWSARMEYILNNILLALLECPGSTLIGVNRMLADKEYRKKVVDCVTDPSVKAFWIDEFAKYGERYMQEAGAAIQNKIGQFISNPLVRNIIGQSRSSFDIRKMMDERKIIIINLSKGRVGEQNANLLGSMLITKIYLAALSRADVKESVLKTLPNFYLYVDEFQSFANESFADILSEARKYKLNLTIAHQYIEQMSEEVRAAVFGNVGTMITFRVGAFDAEVLEKEFAPAFTAEDLVNLGIFQTYLKLMIDGVSSQPFSATTLPPIQLPSVSYVTEIIEESRKVFAAPRAIVEEEVKKHAGVDRHEAPKMAPPPRAPMSASAERPQNIPSQSVPRRMDDRPSERISERRDDLSRGGGRDDRRDNRAPSHNDNRPREENRERRMPPAPPLVSPPPDNQDGFVSMKEIASVSIVKKPFTNNNNNNFPRPEKKANTGEHLNDLRQALASVVGNNPPVKKEERPMVNNQAQARPTAVPIANVLVNTKESPAGQIPHKQTLQEKHEVPEEVLRGILGVDKEPKKQ